MNPINTESTEFQIYNQFRRIVNMWNNTRDVNMVTNLYDEIFDPNGNTDVEDYLENELVSDIFHFVANLADLGQSPVIMPNTIGQYNNTSIEDIMETSNAPAGEDEGESDMEGGMIGGMNPELKIARRDVRELYTTLIINIMDAGFLNTLIPRYRNLMRRFSQYFDEPEFYSVIDELEQIRETLGVAVGGSYIQPINQKPDYNFCCGGAITYEYPIKVRQITRDWNRAKNIWMRSSRQQADIDRATRNFDKKYEELFKELESKGSVVRPDPTDVDGFAIEILDEAAEEELRKYFEWLDNLEVEVGRRISFAEGSGRHGGSYIQPVNAKFLPF